MKTKLRILPFISLALLVSRSQAEVVVSAVEREGLFSQLSTTDDMGAPLITGDLLSTATTELGMPANQNNNIISEFDDPGTDHGEVSVAGSNGGEGFTYAFAMSVDIDRIDVYSGWTDFRAGQSMDIQVSSDGETFSSIINYVEEASGGAMLVQISDDAGGKVAIGVTHIRFIPTGQSLAVVGAGSVFREIDVIALQEEVSTQPQITEISKEGNNLNITWNSIDSANYSVYYSTDLINWDEDFEDSVAGAAGETKTTRSYDLSELGLVDRKKLFVRVVKN